MNALCRNKTFYECNLDKRILELEKNSENFNIKEFLISEFKGKIKTILESEVLWFNKDAINDSKNHFYSSLKNILNNYDLAEVYDNKNQYIKEEFDIIWKESENYTYVWNPDEVPYKINDMKNRINDIKIEYLF